LYDVVILLSAIHYAKNPRSVVRNVRRSMSKDGLFILEGGVLFAEEQRLTDIPLPGWRKVGDRCLHMTDGFIRRHLLLDYNWRIMCERRMRGRDDVPRYVIHAPAAGDEAEEDCYTVDVIDFFLAAKQSAGTIVEGQ